MDVAGGFDDAEVVLRPAGRRLRKLLAAIAPATVLMAVGLSFWTATAAARGRSGAAGTIAIVLVMVAFLVAYLALYMRNFSVFACHGYFGRTDALGRRRVWPREALDRAVLRTVNFGQGANPRYMLIATDGKPLIQFSPRMFEPVATDALFRQLSVQVDARDEVMSPAELRREFPKAVSLWAAHPLLFGFGFVFCLMAILALMVAATVLSHQAR